MKRLITAAGMLLLFFLPLLAGSDEQVQAEPVIEVPAEKETLPETVEEPETLGDFRKINARIGYVLKFEDDGRERIIPVVSTADFDSVFRKNIYGEEDSMGSVFCDEGPYEPANLVIYGHASRTKDRCFSFLQKLADRSYYESHPYFTLESENGKSLCRIVSFARYDLEDESTYLGWAEPAPGDIREMFSGTVPYLLEHTQGITDAGNGIVTLVTCDLDMQDGRYVVQAVRSDYESIP